MPSGAKQQLIDAALQRAVRHAEVYEVRASRIRMLGFLACAVLLVAMTQLIWSGHRYLAAGAALLAAAASLGAYARAERIQTQGFADMATLQADIDAAASLVTADELLAGIRVRELPDEPGGP